MGNSIARRPDGDGDRSRPAVMSPQQIETWVDQTIRQAQQRGEFDNLPGAGKPLASLDRPDDPDWWIKDLVQREKIDLSAALPGPMALRRERETFPESLLRLPDEAAVRDVDQMIGRWRALKVAVREAEGPPVEDTERSSPPSLPAARTQWRWWKRLQLPE